MVAAATHSLCEAANALVQGHATEERLISAAKQVAGSTAQLLVACKVKADINSKAMQRLQVNKKIFFGGSFFLLWGGGVYRFDWVQRETQGLFSSEFD